MAGGSSSSSSWAPAGRGSKSRTNTARRKIVLRRTGWCIALTLGYKSTIKLSKVTILREWRPDIEQAKGLAILLVVFGHLVARQDPEGVHWYEPLRRAVY